MRAAIYARYSSDHQSERSIDDQVRVCRERAVGDGGTVVKIYTDYAISGANAINRPGLQALLADARAGAFDVVVSEALDRISRDQEDVAAIYKRLRHADVGLVTLAEGAVDELHIGFKGTMNALFLRDLAAKIRRGQRGRIEAGFSAGGLSYGYDVVRSLDSNGDPLRGRRRVNAEKADVVRRIFAEAAAGASGRAIARGLNGDGIAGPTGGHWNASTVNGNRARGVGILCNPLYVGRLVFNRTTMRKDPDSGRRTHRLNPEAEWIVTEAPDLRIVEDAVWDRVRAIRDANAGRALHNRRRPRRLLSGLVRCGVCGGAITVIGEDRFGCSRHRETGMCSNGRTISVRKVERRILGGLGDRLLAPDRVEEYVRQVHAEMKRRRRDEGREKRHAAKRLARVERDIERLITMITDGLFTASMKTKLIALEGEKVELTAALVALDTATVLDFHPDLPAIFRAKVEKLQQALNADGDTRRQAITILRSLIDKIVLHPGPNHGQIQIELHGAIANVIGLGNNQGTSDDECMLMVVAEEGVTHYRATVACYV